MKTLKKIMEKILGFLMVIIIIAILFCVYSFASIKLFHRDYINIFGYTIFEVATGSMADSINIGDAVIVKINDKYKENDVVTYKSGNDYITHRVVGVDNDFIITKGDANNVNDNPIDKGLVLGKVVKVIPELGVWKKVLLTPKVIVLIILTLLIFSILFSYNGKSIKIVSSKKSDEEMNKIIEEEVNKKVASMKRRRHSEKKILDATQVLDITEIKKEIEVPKTKKMDNKKILDATQLIDISEIKKINNTSKNKHKVLDATQIIDISTLKDSARK